MADILATAYELVNECKIGFRCRGYRIILAAMSAIITKTCTACREPHLFFLPIGNAAEPGRHYEYTCPKTRAQARLEQMTSDRWKYADSKPPGSVIVREVVAGRS